MAYAGVRDLESREEPRGPEVLYLYIALQTRIEYLYLVRGRERWGLKSKFLEVLYQYGMDR